MPGMRDQVYLFDSVSHGIVHSYSARQSPKTVQAIFKLRVLVRAWLDSAWVLAHNLRDQDVKRSRMRAKGHIEKLISLESRERGTGSR